MVEKPVSKDRRLYEALKISGGWNPMTQTGRVVRFRCMNCGTLLGVAAEDMQGEFEHKCPVCKHVHVFNRPQPQQVQPRIDPEILKILMRGR